MLEKGDCILTALSGGSDSVAMLFLLIEYAENHPELELKLHALHFNHKIRGDAADADENFCRELCNQLNIGFISESADVPAYARETGKTLEEAARDLRYKALRARAKELCEETKIAVAHNKNDRQETVFFNIARGTSVEGLRGIRYVNGDVIRPLLDITKEQTYEICREHGVNYRVDATNFETDATRNKIRLKIIPYVDEVLGIDFGEKLTEISDFAIVDSDFCEKCAEEEYRKIFSGGKAETKTLLSLHPSIKTRVVRIAVAAAEIRGQKPFDGGVSITRSMIMRVLDFAEKGENGGYIELGKELIVKKDGKYIVFTDFEEFLKSPDYTLEVSEAEGEELKKAVKEARKSSETMAVFDKDELMKITGGRLPVLRTMEAGDTFSPIGGSGTKPLRRFLTDAKTDRDKRKNIPVLADKSTVFEVFGIRRSKYATIHSDSKCGIIFRLVYSEKG